MDEPIRSTDSPKVTNTDRSRRVADIISDSVKRHPGCVVESRPGLQISQAVQIQIKILTSKKRLPVFVDFWVKKTEDGFDSRWTSYVDTGTFL